MIGSWLKLLKKMMCACSLFNVKCQFNPGDLFKAQSLITLNYTSRKNLKPLFEVNFRKNSTKTIRLFALGFHEVIPPHRNLELII